MILMLALSSFYVAGMYLNDAFDAGYDRVHQPYRPIPSGAVATATVVRLGAVLIGTGLALLIGLGLAPGGHGLSGPAAGLALAVAIVVYDIWHKGNPIGPVLMGLCRALVYFTTAVSVAGSLPSDVIWAGTMALCYLVGLTYAAKQEDRSQLGHAWPLIFLGAPLIYAAPMASTASVGLLLYAAFLAAVAYALALMVRLAGTATPRVVSVLIAGICLLDALFVAGAGQPVLAFVTALGFPLTLALQRAVIGT